MARKRSKEIKSKKTHEAKGNEDEDLADLILSEAYIDWDELKKDLPYMPTNVLIDEMVDLGLYVNKEFALEIAKRDDAPFWLRRMVQSSRYWYDGGPGDGWAPFHAIHILALVKSEDALALFLDILRFRQEDLSDWLTEDVHALLYAFGEKAIDPLMKYIEDGTLDSFARGACTSALRILSRKYPAHKEKVKAHLLKLLRTTIDSTFAGVLVDDLALFYDPALMPAIEKAFDDDKVDTILLTMDDIVEIMNENDEKKERRYNRETKNPLEHFSRKNILHLHSMCYPSTNKERFGRKIGVNDPCPCGSGKKYKKCCMIKENLT